MSSRHLRHASKLIGLGALLGAMLYVGYLALGAL